MIEAMLVLGLVLLVAILIFFALITNPYAHRFFQTPFQVVINENEIEILPQSELRVDNNPFLRLFAYFKCALHIILNPYFGSKKSVHSHSEDIMRDIHVLRFDTSKPYLISGDHFNMFYLRSLGIFYHSALDPRIALSKKDWEQKQAMIAQSTLFGLETAHQMGDLTTTVVPTGRHRVTGINIYDYPSDSLYSLLYALRSMQTSKDILHVYPFKSTHMHHLQTKELAERMVETYQETLISLYQKYKLRTFDPVTSLIKPWVQLSGTKDITKRQCAFYDNVIFWQTTRIGQELGILPKNDKALHLLKSKIIKTFWDKTQGNFLEDTSEESIAQHYYSSDWLIAFMTGFINVADENDLEYLTQSINFIRTHKLDHPFPLKYHAEDRKNRQYPLVKTFLPSYGGSMIWSHWGMEYIKLLLLVGEKTQNQTLFHEARSYLWHYKTNMEKYRGYPEVYNSDGTMVDTPWYTSVRQTGWVVNFEQALAMYHAIAERPLAK